MIADKPDRYICLPGNVIVRDDKDEERTPGGLYIPDKRAPKKVKTGIVLSAGPRKLKDGRTLPSEVKAGDRVLYDFLSGVEGLAEKNNDGTITRVLKYGEIMAIVKEEDSQ